MINRPEDITVYACGPIDGCTYEETHGWREEFIRTWPGLVLDPCRRSFDVGQYKDIVELDKIDIAQSEAILVNAWKAGWGSAMEIIYAWSLGKIVVVLWPANRMISPWVRYHSHSIIVGGGVPEAKKELLKFFTT